MFCSPFFCTYLIYVCFADQPHSYAQDDPIPTHSWPPESFDVTSGDEDSLTSSLGGAGGSATGKGLSVGGAAVLDPAERRANAMQILRMLLHDSSAVEGRLVELLCAK